MTHSNTRYRKARTVSWVNASTNSLLAILKIFIGYLGNSHALIADGLHSFSDLIGDILVWAAAKIGGQHADQDHPYGHQRIETLASILIALILISVAVSIVYEALPHLIGKQTPTHPGAWVIVVASISIVANEWLYRYTLAASKSIHSNLLLTYAWHNRSDVYVSLIVFASVLGAMLGLPALDSIGAIIIAMLIFKIAIKMIWNNARELIDTGVNADTKAKIIHCIQATPGVASIHQLRSRTHGDNIFVDVHIIVDPKISVSEGHFISDQVYMHLHQKFPNISDITVHIDPEDDESYRPCMHLPNREKLKTALEPHWQHLPGYRAIQKTQLHYLNGNLYIELFIEADAIKNQRVTTLQQQYFNAAKAIPHINSIKIYPTE